MSKRFSAIVRSVAALAFAGFLPALGGCSPITYGTGTRVEMQTLEDLSSIASLGGKPAEEINYRPRGGIVLPPTGALPAPAGAKPQTADANWPVDQDVMARDLRNKRVAALKEGKTDQPLPGADPGFRLPKGATTQPAATGDKEGFKQLAAVKGGASGSFDANGKPVRQFLTEPPNEYRQVDANAVADAAAAPKKKKWYWPFGS